MAVCIQHKQNKPTAEHSFSVSVQTSNKGNSQLQCAFTATYKSASFNGALYTHTP